ncbi:MAG: DASH family cryptochrome [Porticoccaceae bacterium]
MSKKGIFWFTTDLRLDDNQALNYAASQVDQLILVYCPDDCERLTSFQMGQCISSNRQRFLNQSLADLQKNLQTLNQHLIICEQPKQHLAQIIDNYAITHIFRSGGQHCLNSASWESLKAKYSSVSFTEISGNRLFDAQQLPFELSQLPSSFSKFRRKTEKLEVQPPQRGVNTLPSAMIDPVLWPKTYLLSESNDQVDFAGGETAANSHLDNYFNSSLASVYKETRNGLDGMDYSTKFSPWLALGCISVRRIIQRLKHYESEIIANDSTYWIYFELLWREYFQWYAEHHGAKMTAFSGIKERAPTTSFYPERFQKWCQGTTPYPIVNACMKQLKSTGYMSNRGRQLVASCFVHELSLDWRYGAAYMEQQLIDFDLGSNWGNWQYLAGVGADPRGHRQFDLNKQTQIYDPQEQFIQRWQGQCNSLPLDSTDPSDWPISSEITA